MSLPHLRTRLAAAGAAVALIVGGVTAALTLTPSAAQTAGPRSDIAVTSCNTDGAGRCTVSHKLGVTPDAILVSTNTPGNNNAYMLNTVQGSFTPTTFTVRAMFNQTTPKTNGTIWFTYYAYTAGVTPPPSSTTATPPSTTMPPTSATPPATSSTATTPPTTTTSSSNTCTNPTLINEQDGRTFPAPGTTGQFYVHNDAWNWQGNDGKDTGQFEKLYLCSYNSWYVDSWGFDTPNGEVFMYPSTKWDATTAGCCAGKPLSTWPNTVTGRFAGAVSGYDNTSSYNVAWDLWLNGVASGNYTEMMIWTQKGGNAAPAGSRRPDWTAPNGQVYEVWWDGNTSTQAGGSYLAFISKTTQLNGTIDIRAFIAESATRGYVDANPTLNQLNYGIEVRDTGAATRSVPARFTLSDFALTMN